MQALPATDPHAATRACAAYRLDIYTGGYRGAGTSSPARVQLFGEEGQTDEFVVGDSEIEEGGFARGSVQSYLLPVNQWLGTIKRVFVSKAQSSISELGSGWFLQKIVVHGPDGERWLFPCEAWFGQSESGEIRGDLERNLLPAHHAVTIDKPLQVRVDTGAICIPHPDKVKDGMRGVCSKAFGYAGEDAYFACHGQYVNNANNVVGMGVADGIWMWKTKGIDSGLFSRALLETASRMVKQGYSDVVTVLKTCNRKVESEGIYGSSTIALAVIDCNTGRLHAATLGDGGFMIIGTSPDDSSVHVKYRTDQQEHEFGRPYQLGHHANADNPDDAMLVTLQLRHGDTVVMGSDGLLDNVAPQDIVQETIKARKQHRTPQALAQELCRQAFNNSIDRDKVTPYSLAASEWFNMVYNGGKKDDITVVAAFVEADTQSSNS